MSPPEQYEAQKFKELVLYVAWKSESDEKFGALKLNKILFYSDFWAYGRYGKTITGATYQHLKMGPAPKALPPARRELEESGAAVVRNTDYYGKKQNRLVPLRRPDLSLFRAEEIALVDEVIAKLWNKNGMEVSELSHLEVGWQITDMQEQIPYSTVFVSDEMPSPQVVARAREIATQYGWLAR